jgi:hypothetical protein
MNKYKESRRERRCQRFVSRDLAFHWTVSVPGSSRASVIHSLAAAALAIAIVGVAGVSLATDVSALSEARFRERAQVGRAFRRAFDKAVRTKPPVVAAGAAYANSIEGS